MLSEIRPLTRDDAEAADALAAEAFGAPPRDLPEPWPVPGTCPWGAFAGHELAGVATVRAFRSWFGGDAVPIAGIAAVAVRPEHRGAGLLAPLFAALLADVDVPVEPLTRIPAPAGITLRRADPDDERDVAAHRAVYDGWAGAQNGPLTREGVLQQPLGGHDTVTLAVDASGTPVGYAAWSRADASALPVHELIALTAPAA
ncbi:MAG: GNAT family N-acetyltransferase, partial [Pseudonocardia sp.]